MARLRISDLTKSNDKDRSLIDIIELALKGRYFRIHDGETSLYCFDQIREDNESGDSYIVLKNVSDPAPETNLEADLYNSRDFIEVRPEDMVSYIKRGDGLSDREESEQRKAGYR